MVIGNEIYQIEIEIFDIGQCGDFLYFVQGVVCFDQYMDWNFVVNVEFMFNFM